MAPASRSEAKPTEPGRPMTSRNAARERSRVQSLRDAFQSLQSSLPAVPPDTKLSKLDVLILASAYINHLSRMLDHSSPSGNAVIVGHRFHPVKKWPMRTRLYGGLDPTRLDVCPCYSISAPESVKWPPSPALPHH